MTLRHDIDVLVSSIPEPWDLVVTTDIPPNTWKAIQRDKAIDMAKQLSVTKEALPETSRIAAKIVNNLDDLQDILASALLVGKWVAPRALARFMPGIGAALLVSDALNLATLIFSYLTPSGILLNSVLRKTTKKRLAPGVFSNPFSSKALSTAAKDFLIRRTTVGDLLQLLQATNSLFGNGISLGSIMGAIDTSVAVALKNMGITRDTWQQFIPGDIQTTSTKILQGIEGYTAVPLEPAQALRYHIIQATVAHD
jgi:hypothetical protein